MFLHKLFRIGGGGGSMECGEVGRNQYRETAGPTISPSKGHNKKYPENILKIILHMHYNLQRGGDGPTSMYSNTIFIRCRCVFA